MNVITGIRHAVGCIACRFRLFRLFCEFRDRKYDMRTSFNFARNRAREMRGLK